MVIGEDLRYVRWCSRCFRLSFCNSINTCRYLDILIYIILTISPRMFYRSGWLRCVVFKYVFSFWVDGWKVFRFWGLFGDQSSLVWYLFRAGDKYMSIRFWCWRMVFISYILYYYTYLYYLILYSSSFVLSSVLHPSSHSVSGGNTHSVLPHHNLTPHVLSEWMVEVCRFEYCIRCSTLVYVREVWCVLR